MEAMPPSASGAETQERRGPADGNGRVNLNRATYDKLRAMGLSITQAKRLIAFRERRGGLGSLDELDEVPGFPGAQLADLKRRSRVDRDGQGGNGRGKSEEEAASRNGASRAGADAEDEDRNLRPNRSRDRLKEFQELKIKTGRQLWVE